MTIDYGTLLKMRREDLGYSQEDVAAIADVHRTTVIRAESGKSMTLGVFLSILHALNLRIEVITDENHK